ncbi:class I SAM-dependent methyltransferase [bacterium]|nr:class I SAM-dependent methyltransferase [bacterium]
MLRGILNLLGFAEKPAESQPAGGTIKLLYPIEPKIRYGWGKAVHGGLEGIIAARKEEYARVLRQFAESAQELAAIPFGQKDQSKLKFELRTGTPSTEPFWDNPFITGIDGISIYCFLKTMNPKRYFEVGSGNSTRFARRAIRDHGLQTKITSIDPEPRAEIDSICDRVIRQKAQDLDPAILDELEPGDILFIDGSHYVFMNSDVVAIFLDWLPRLKPGVLYGFHDIFLPCDYPESQVGLYFSEQYMLAVALLEGAKHFDIKLPAVYAALDTDLQKCMEPVWKQPGMEKVPRFGCGFWMERK